MRPVKGKNVLVTGGAGFIGSHLVDALLEEGAAVLVVVDNMYLGRPANIETALSRIGRVFLYEKDASNKAAMAEILKRHEIEVVFNLAVVPLPASLTEPKYTVDQNVLVTTTFCELLREGLYQSLIHFSSSEIYGTARTVPMDETHPLEPITPYAASKLACDHIVFSYVRTFGLDAAILRPFNNYGPRQNSGKYAGVIPLVIARVLKGEAVEIQGDGEQTRDFIFVRDTARAALEMYAKEELRGKVVNIASGREVSINRLVETILAELGSPQHEIRHTSGRPGDVRRHCADISLACKLLGFGPRTGFSEGMKETVAWYAESLKV